MSKYEWANVPKEVEWIATDDDGVSHGFDGKPVIGENGLWTTDDYDYERVYDLTVANFDLFDKSSWRDSLEERPK